MKSPENHLKVLWYHFPTTWGKWLQNKPLPWDRVRILSTSVKCVLSQLDSRYVASSYKKLSFLFKVDSE